MGKSFFVSGKLLRGAENVGRISHLRMLKMNSHFLRPRLGTPQISVHIALHLYSF